MTNPVMFSELGLPDSILKAITELGYEKPSPIQERSLPVLLNGQDLLGQAQTGTGKTAAFALPLLSKIDPKLRSPQLLVLAPTRELAIQVAEACQQYSKHIKGLNILPIYGGQSYTIQLRQLKRGAQVVVGTPGRVMDHMRRNTLVLDDLKSIVLDEADEMLRMGFIDDVKWVLEQAPQERQVALFSATMPKEVKKVADQHLSEPAHIKIESKTATASNISQRYWVVKGTHKLDAITRVLESENTDGVIVFVRTKNATVELADKLQARGFRAEPLNGDIPQANREKVVDRLKQNKLDLLIATDVVARGLDVERISHVINYDVPHDTESYIHRIGRTGRAGRSGQAILFIAPREKRMLRAIERATKQNIEPMPLPSVDDINKNRVERFKGKIIDAIQSENLDIYSQLITELQSEHEVSAEQIAAASCFIAQGGTKFLLEENELVNDTQGNRVRRSGDAKPAPDPAPVNLKDFPDVKMERFLIHVGHQHRVKPGSIVGCIANEAELESKYIGDIEIRDTYSTVDLPADMPKEVMGILRKARVSNKPLMIEKYKSEPESEGESKREWKSKDFKAKRRSGFKSGDRAGNKNGFKKDGYKGNSEGSKKSGKSYNSKKQKSNKGKKGATSEYAKKKRKDRKK